MAEIPKETIERILVATDIVELVGESVPLKRVGQSYQGLCPFHSEKTPSFTVSREKGIYHCFGCQAGGNAINFLTRLTGMHFRDAVKTLAEKAGINLETEQDTRRDEILFCLDKAAQEFHRQLLSGKYPAAMQYLRERGLRDDTIERFALGYAGSVPELIKTLKASGVSKSAALETRLLREKERGDTSPFASRITLPIHDPRGHVVGFGGRAVGHETQAKYINSHDSRVFNKRRLLYGMSLAKPISETTLLVEGYFDVITLHQAGLTNALGTLGTEFSPKQAEIARRTARQLILIFDGDRAGRSALLKSLRISRPETITRAALLPHGDPDSFLRENGRKALLDILKRSPEIKEAAARSLLARAKQGEKRARLAEEAVSAATAMEDPVEAALFAEEAAKNLDLPSWSLQEKAGERREKRENILERKKTLERALLEALNEFPELRDKSRLKVLQEAFEEGEGKRAITRLMRQPAQTITPDTPVSTIKTNNNR